jgi:N-acetylmuramic acid 6-phosphate etherase
MVRMGKVYENLMVDLNAYACRKLTDRATRIIATLTGRAYADSGRLLRAARGRVKAALLMDRGLSREAAERLLARHGGHVRAALAAHQNPERQRAGARRARVK